jgi:hypothetical protein
MTNREIIRIKVEEAVATAREAWRRADKAVEYTITRKVKINATKAANAAEKAIDEAYWGIALWERALDCIDEEVGESKVEEALKLANKAKKYAEQAEQAEEEARESERRQRRADFPEEFED